MKSSYYYLRDPTREIRLLDLLLKAASGNLRCCLRRATIGDIPSFIFVSHVWGIKKVGRHMHLILISGAGPRIYKYCKILSRSLLGYSAMTLTSFRNSGIGGCATYTRTSPHAGEVPDWGLYHEGRVFGITSLASLYFPQAWS
jgi:hypothetical protein